jgi:predicted DNA-binding protein YlxM (UPF0122 family)
MALDINARQRVQRLLDVYGQLLTDQQRETLRLHVDRDWSYAEIARSQGVTRTAVYDMVHRSEAALEDYEAKVGLVAAEEQRQADRDRLGKRLVGLQAKLVELQKSVKELT